MLSRRPPEADRREGRVLDPPPPRGFPVQVVVDGALLASDGAQVVGVSIVARNGTLARLYQLEELYMGWNLIHDAGPLAALVNLKELFLVAKRITDIGPLVDNNGLAARG